MLNRATFAFRHILVLPIADRLLGVRPQSPVGDAKLMVVDGCFDPARDQILDRFHELRLIIDRVDPEILEVRLGESCHLETHPYHLIHKGQIARDETGQLRQPIIGLLVNYHANFYQEAATLEIENAADGLVEGTISLDDIVVPVAEVGINRNPEHEVVMANPGERLREAKIGEGTAIGQDV